MLVFGIELILIFSAPDAGSNKSGPVPAHSIGPEKVQICLRYFAAKSITEHSFVEPCPRRTDKHPVVVAWVNLDRPGKRPGQTLVYFCPCRAVVCASQNAVRAVWSSAAP